MAGNSTIEIPGPYATQVEAYHDTEDIRRALTIATARAMRLERLTEALRLAGVPLGAYDLEVLGWLADVTAATTVQSVAGMLLRAWQAGRTSVPQADASVYVPDNAITCHVPVCPCTGDVLDVPRRTTPLQIAAALGRHLAERGVQVNGAGNG